MPPPVGRSRRSREAALGERPSSDAAPSVIRLATLRGKPGWVLIVVDGTRMAMLPESSIVECGVRDGDEWNGRVAKRVWAFEARALAAKDAVAVLARGPVGDAALATRLAARGHSTAAIGPALEALLRAGIPDECERAAARARNRAGSRGEDLVRADLEARGFDHSIAARAAREAARDRDGADDAEKLARSKLRAMSKQNPSRAAPRLAAMLANRGYDEDTVLAAIERVLGPAARDALSSSDAHRAHPEAD